MKETGNSGTMSEKLDFLCGLGFEVSGTWVLEDGKRVCRLSGNQDRQDVLYAFVANGDVLYIGKSVRSLHQRIYGYQNPGPTQSTNIKNGQNITDLLKKGVTVEVYVLVPTEPIMYHGLEVNLAGGLEDQLINRLNPPWNRNM